MDPYFLLVDGRIAPLFIGPWVYMGEDVFVHIVGQPICKFINDHWAIDI
jgi:hypothetical protein